MEAVREWRKRASDSYNFNWLLRIPPEFQMPFEVNHATMRALALQADLPAHTLAANLRRAFSGIVTGNVKEYGLQLIEKAGPFELKGDGTIMRELDGLLTAFVEQKRMKIASGQYTPCYRLVT